MKKIKIPNAGFTLVEMLMYMGLSAIFLVSLSQIFVLIANIRLESEATSAVQQDGQYLLSRFEYDLGRSTSITLPPLGQNGNTLQTNVFTLALDGSGNLQLTEGALIDNLNSSNSKLSNLSFLHLGTTPKDTVQVSFALTSNGRSQAGPETRQFQTTLGLR